MKIFSKVLLERATTTVFHSTELFRASQLLKSGAFNFSPVKDDNEAKFADGKHYYLSLARSSRNGYAENQTQDFDYDGGMDFGIPTVMFNINGDYINNRYKVRPVEFKSVMPDVNQPNSKAREMEDRVLSNTPKLEIPKDATKLITSVHVYIPGKSFSGLTPGYETIKSDAREVIIWCKQHHVPVFFYKSRKHFLNQDKFKAKVLNHELIQKEFKWEDPILSFEHPDVRRAEEKERAERAAKERKTDALRYEEVLQLKAWRELWFKNDENKLSDRAKKILANGVILGALNRAIAGNGSQSEGMRRMINVFRWSNSMTPQEYVEKMKTKWKTREKLQAVLGRQGEALKNFDHTKSPMYLLRQEMEKNKK